MADCYCLSLKESINLHCDNVKKAPWSNTVYAFSNIFTSEEIYVQSGSEFTGYMCPPPHHFSIQLFLENLDGINNIADTSAVGQTWRVSSDSQWLKGSRHSFKRTKNYNRYNHKLFWLVEVCFVRDLCLIMFRFFKIFGC